VTTLEQDVSLSKR